MDLTWSLHWRLVHGGIKLPWRFWVWPWVLVVWTRGFLGVNGTDFIKINKRFTDGGVRVIKVIEELRKFLSIKANGIDTDAEETTNNGFDTLINFGGSLVISIAIDLGNEISVVTTEKTTEDIFSLSASFFEVVIDKIWHHDKERLIHNVGFLRK